jgi:hypothetical protein
MQRGVIRTESIMQSEFNGKYEQSPKRLSFMREGKAEPQSEWRSHQIIKEMIKQVELDRVLR